MDVREVFGTARAVLAFLVPVACLHAEEYADDDDEKLDEHAEPVALAHPAKQRT